MWDLAYEFVQKQGVAGVALVLGIIVGMYAWQIDNRDTAQEQAREKGQKEEFAAVRAEMKEMITRAVEGRREKDRALEKEMLALAVASDKSLAQIEQDRVKSIADIMTRFQAFGEIVRQLRKDMERRSSEDRLRIRYLERQNMPQRRAAYPPGE